MAGCPMHHGVTKARGCTHVAVSNFSKLFPQLAGVTLTEQEANIIGGPGGLMHDFDDESPESPIPSGYIFFSQFIDHDVTLDATTGLRDAPKSNDVIESLPNIRSASLDLDCVYGFGPEGSPHIYDGSRPGRLAINPNGFDLARSPDGVALIGDPRNDENIFIAQIQLLFHKFHNKLFNQRITSTEPGHPLNRFEEAQKQTRYHYQWLVLFDFLKRLCDPAVFKYAARKLVEKHNDFPHFYGLDSHGKLTMPVEFSVAAYRVGHTLVRSTYAVNDANLDIELFDERFGTLGFNEYPEDLMIDWRYLLDVDDAVNPRLCKGLDPLLADELQALPDPVVGSNNPSNKALAFRNLMRGNAMSLPSGQAVAAALQGAGYPVNPSFDLRLSDPSPGNTRVRVGFEQLDQMAGGMSPLRSNTPLFYYILRESEVQHMGQRFGAVGSAILMEVFGGMLKYCSDTFLNGDEPWNPDPQVSKEARKKHIFSWPHVWREETFEESFNRYHLIDRDDFYPFELADVVRFVES